MKSQEGEYLLPTINQHKSPRKDADCQVRNGRTNQEQGQGKDELRGPSAGLRVFTTVVFLVGEMAGSGILALPKAMELMGYLGIVLLLIFGLLSAYTGKLLGTCWLMVQDRYEEYRGHVRHPYPLIGQITYGKPARLLVSFCNNFTLFGGSTVFLILASQNVQSLVRSVMGHHFPFCYIQLIVASLLVPLSWMGTPKEFWPIAFGAASATSVACVILLVAFILDKLGPYSHVRVSHKTGDTFEFFQSLGVVLFTLGGHPSFPTFQNDMKQPQKFGKAVFLAYMFVAMMYLPIALGGFLVYGKHLDDNILNTISSGPLLCAVQILITCHLLCAFVIVLNPVVQEVEELCKMPKEFTWKRVISRSLAVGLVLFTAESIPRFSAILSLIGGSSMAILVCILPPLFFLKLRKMEGPWPNEHIPLHVKVLLIEIVLIGVVVGVLSTYGSLKRITSPDSFTKPCYLNMSIAGT